MQGVLFFDRPLRIKYGKSKSDAIAKLDGTYIPRDKLNKRKQEALEKKDAERRRKQEHKPAPLPPAPPAGMLAPPVGVPQTAAIEQADPNNTVFVENLPEQVNEMMLQMLFQQFPGFREVRLVPGRNGIAFVDFENEVQSTVAMNGLQNFKITPTNLMKITFAKR